MGRQSQRVVEAQALPIGYRWPEGSSLAEKQAEENTWGYVGSDPERKKLSAAERQAASAQPMPAELYEHINQAPDTPPAMREALSLAAQLNTLRGGLRRVRYRNGPRGFHGAIVEVKLVPLCSGIMCDEERRALFRRPEQADVDEDEEREIGVLNGRIVDNEKKKRDRPLYEIHPGGMPVLHTVRRPAGAPERPAPEEVLYEVSWSTRPEIEPQVISEKELNDGSCWSRWAPLALSSKPQYATFANIVKSQRTLFEVDIEVVPRRSGLYHDREKGWRYVGITEPIFGYVLPAPRAQEFDGFTLPGKPDAEALAALGQWLSGIDPKGRYLVLAGLALRSLVSTIEPAATSAILIGSAGCGKTSAANFVRGVLGPCAFDALADDRFSSTATRIELSIRPLGDMPILIDDAHGNDAMAASARASIFETMDRITMAAANGGEMRGRSNRDVVARQGTHIAGLPIATFNTLAGARPEQLRRWVYLPLTLGEIDREGFATDFDRFQLILTSAGQAVRCGAVRRLNSGLSGENELRRSLRERDRQFAGELIEAVGELRPEADPGVLHSVARNFATALTGMWLADRAAGAEGTLVEHLRPHLPELIAAQLDAIEAGGIDLPDAEDVHAALREAFSRDAYLLDRKTNKPISEAVHPDPVPDEVLDLGYVYRGDRIEPKGSRRLGWFEDGVMHLLQEPLLDVLFSYLGRKGRPVNINRQTFPAMLVDREIALPGRERDRHTRQIHAPQGGRKYRVVSIPYRYETTAGTAGTAGTATKNSNTNNSLSVPAPKPEEYKAGTDNRLISHSNSAAVPAVPAVPAPISAYREADDPGEPPAWLDEAPPIEPPEGEPLTAGEPIEAPSKQERAARPPARAAERPKADSPSTDSQNGKGRSTAAGEALAGNANRNASTNRNRDPAEQDRIPRTRGESRRVANPLDEPINETEVVEPASYPAKQDKIAHARAAPIGDRELRGKSILALDDRSAFLVRADGTVAPAPELFEAMRPGAPLAAMLDRAEQAEIEQLALHLSYCHAAGLPREPNTASDNPRVRQSLPHDGLAHTWAELPDGCGWVLSEPGRLRSSMFARRPDRPGPAIEIMLPGYDGRDHTPLGLAPDAEHLAHTLNEYRNATAVDGRTGFTLRSSAPHTWHAMLRALSRDRRRDRRILDISEVPAPADYPPPAHALPECVADLAFAQRADLLTAAERSAAQLAVIDGNCQYMRQLGAINYGLGKPIPVDRPADLTRAGWYYGRYMAPNWPDRLPPPGWPLAPDEDGWLVAETIAFLVSIGCQVTIDHAWQWSGQGRVLGRLQKRFSMAYDRLIERGDDPALPAPARFGASLSVKVHKGGYKAGVGQFSRSDNRTKTGPIFSHRPHWRHAIIAASTAGILRDLRAVAQRTELSPVAIATDGLAFLTDNAEGLIERLGLRQGRRIGQYKLSAIRDAGEMRELLRRAEATADRTELGRIRGEIMSMITGTGRAE